MINLLCALDSGKRTRNAHDNLILKLTVYANGIFPVFRARRIGAKVGIGVSPYSLRAAAMVTMKGLPSPASA